MKRVLLAICLFAAVGSFAQGGFLPCDVIDFSINNGGGNCAPLDHDNDPSTPALTATGVITLRLSLPVSPDYLPTITGVIENGTQLTGYSFGVGVLLNNGHYRICYYIGPNNANNLSGANEYTFIISYLDAQGNLVPCRPDNIPLPVKFSMFTASRNKSNVAIKWETSTEVNNLGFYVQRNVRGTWETVTFVPSQAHEGNSNSPLSYSISDLNTTKGVSQYRILQVDIDGRSKYSDIRSVRGEAMSGKTLVYPNPSQNGNVNVVFDDQSPKNVVISDMNGRVIRKYNSAVNNLAVDNLENGVYSIQVIDLSTSVITVEKVVVKKR